ncbi:MAG: hydroxypyruvate isomerase [Gemmatimonadetes bacterium]|nr:hydroxypyruvate isomerase [Gemmatimonadota bacterium]
MPQFAANLTMLWTEVPFLDRFERAARAGFRAVEFLFPYPYDAGELKSRLDAHGLRLVLHNLPAGNWDAGERGIACLPGREAEFREGVATAIHYATALGVPRVNCLVGKTPDGVDAATVHATVVGNLRHAARALAAHGIQLLVEPINTFDIPGFWLSRTADAIALIDAVGEPNVMLQYDIYHAQRTEGELAATIERYRSRIGHVQLADNPGRHEPGTGEINYPFLFAHLDRLGYAGHVGCEYRPATTTDAGLTWLTHLAVSRT